MLSRPPWLMGHIWPASFGMAHEIRMAFTCFKSCLKKKKEKKTKKSFPTVAPAQGLTSLGHIPLFSSALSACP